MQTAHDPVSEFISLGVTAFTTTREAGSFSLSGSDPVGEVLGRWTNLLNDLAYNAHGITVAQQVHGDKVISHATPWNGLLRTPPADGHATMERGIALAVTVADCVPIFLAHPSGVVAALHSGWRGTVAKIVHQGIRTFATAGLPADELSMHLGPSICGRCYEVSADVRAQLTGETATRPGCVDLRSLIVDDAKAAGIQNISVSPWCTRCDNDRFFSHRAGDSGRQVSVILVNR